jgi:lysozyme
MPRIKVIDLSHYNVIPQSLKPAYAQGVRGVIHKLTEGTGWKDSKAAARYSLAKDAKMLFGVYHFIRNTSIDKQVDWFLDNASPIMDGSTLIACDWEDSGVSPDDVNEFMEQLRDRTGQRPVLYGGNVIKQFEGELGDLTQYRLWLAQYDDDYELPIGWNDYYLWQYSDGENGPDPHEVDGINPPVDCNDYQGSDRDLAETWAGIARPEPDIKIVEIAIDAPANVVVNVTVNGTIYGP